MDLPSLGLEVWSSSFPVQETSAFECRNGKFDGQSLRGLGSGYDSFAVAFPLPKPQTYLE